MRMRTKRTGMTRGVICVECYCQRKWEDDMDYVSVVLFTKSSQLCSGRKQSVLA